MRYVPFRPARLQARTRRAARDTQRYVRDSLAINAGNPPWHRGFVAVGNIGIAMLLAWLLNEPSAAYLAVGFSLLYTLSDAEGTLGMRLHAIAWATAFMGFGSITAFVLRDDPASIVTVFCVGTFVAGALSWAGLPFLRAPRFGVIIFCVVLASGIASLEVLLLLLAGTTITAVVLVMIEHRLAPDQTRTSYSTFRVAWQLINADRHTVLRFSFSYVIATAIGWSAGRAIDEVHPTWVAISVLVCMWPDWQKSYQRVLQRVFGSVVGAGLAMVIAPRINDPRLLIGLIVALFFFVPYGVRRNYWLHCALMALVVFLGMKLASDAGFTRQAVEERVADIVLGSSIAILGTLFAFRKRDRSPVVIA
jgi:fructose-specific phosphotransferase system IIC component